MGALIRAKDWAATPLGPVETWSPTLRMMTGFLLANRFPLLLWWGPSFCQIYNDPYRPVLGTKHPWALGQPVNECWAEIWHVIGPLIERPFSGGPATWMEDLALEINRYGFIEETHFTVAYSPVPDDTAPRNIGGVLATVHETTEKVIGERRIQALRDLGARVVPGETAEAACAAAAETLANYDKDVPFALLYLLEEDGLQARLAGASGIGMGEFASPMTVNLGDGAASDAWPLAQAVGGESIILADIPPDRFGTGLPGPWSDPPHSAAVVPIRSHKPHQLAGLLVAGISARIRFDEPYCSFFELMAAQIATAIAGARAYEEERRRADALAEIDRAKTAFFSNVSHEFRTPLTLMLGPLEDALNDNAASLLSAVQRERLDVAHRNSLRLLRLVNTLLDFSRIEAGRAQASYQPTDLAALTADLASGFRSAVERAGLCLRIDCPPLPEPVFVDRDMWEKIVLNLLSNAFKFTFDGDISITTLTKPGKFALKVRDTGVGIAQSELPRIFERFYRIEGQRSRSFEGSGIGLALVHELVRVHGGEIEARSEPGQGTEFTVTLPLGTAHLPPERVGAASNLAATATHLESFVAEALRWLPDTEFTADGASASDPGPADISDGSRARVLLADDNADMRHYVQRLLGDRYDVTAVANGQAALEAIGRTRPDLVLADVMMPVLDGFGLLRLIRADQDLRDLPVILLSARAGEEARAGGLDAGADDYLIKPFSARELLARVGANLTMARVRQQVAETLRARTAELETVLAAVPAAVWFTSDPGANRIHGNQMAARLLRMPEGANQSLSAPEAERPTHFRIFRAGTELGPEELPLQRAARGEVVRDEELEICFDDGSSIVLLAQALPIRDPAGSITGAICTAADITERKRTERELARFKAFAEHSADAHHVLDETGHVVYANPAAARRLGYADAEMLSLNVEDFDPLWSGERLRDLLAQAALGPVPPFESRHRRKDGSTIPVGIAVSVITEEGKPFLSAVIRDLSEQKAKEAVLRRLNDELEGRVQEEVAAREATQAQLAQAQRMEALGQLAGGIAHDFNNVLQGVLGGASLIERRVANPDSVQRLARMVLEAAERGASITNRLLAFSRRGDLRAEAVEPLVLLAGVREVLMHTLGAGVSIRVEAPAGLPLMLVDKGQLETVLVNLAANARDAMGGNGLLTLAAGTEILPHDGEPGHPTNLKAGSYIRLTVTDTGTGMTPETLARAAEPFFTTKTQGKGTGLGLAIARGFAEQSGGALQIESEPGRGAAVKLWLPLATERVSASAIASSDGAGPAERRARLLLVDDEPIVRELLAEEMEAVGYTVIPAPNGSAALALLDAGETVDLLISDFSMPEMDGLALVREVQRRRPRLPAILLTGFASEAAEIAVSGAISGAFTLLRKPVRDKDLAERVAVLLNGPEIAGERLN